MSDKKYHYTNYRYSHYKDDWQAFFDLVAVGKSAPDFEAVNERGKTVRLNDFQGNIIVLETGSMSCPMYIQALPGMNKAAANHPDVVFLMLYTREAHPGHKLPPFQSLQEKIQRVKRLKNEEAENRMILVDDMQGTIHHAYGKMPNSSVVIDKQGVIVFHAQWNDPVAINEVINLLKNGESLDGISPKYIRPKPPLAFRTFNRAGLQSLIDFLIGLPQILYHHWKYD